MPVFSREKLSGTTNGKPLKIGATATPGTTIHTAIAGATAWDEVYIFVSNLSANAVLLTCEFGGVTDPDDLLCKLLSIPANSPPIPIVTGQMLQNALLCRMFASVTNVLIASGYVNRIA